MIEPTAAHSMASESLGLAAALCDTSPASCAAQGSALPTDGKGSNQGQLLTSSRAEVSGSCHSREQSCAVTSSAARTSAASRSMKESARASYRCTDNTRNPASTSRSGVGYAIHPHNADLLDSFVDLVQAANDLEHTQLRQQQGLSNIGGLSPKERLAGLKVATQAKAWSSRRHEEPLHESSRAEQEASAIVGNTMQKCRTLLREGLQFEQRTFYGIEREGGSMEIGVLRGRAFSKRAVQIVLHTTDDTAVCGIDFTPLSDKDGHDAGVCKPVAKLEEGEVRVHLAAQCCHPTREPPAHPSPPPTPP